MVSKYWLNQKWWLLIFYLSHFCLGELIKRPKKMLTENDQKKSASYVSFYLTFRLSKWCSNYPTVLNKWVLSVELLLSISPKTFISNKILKEWQSIGSLLNNQKEKLSVIQWSAKKLKNRWVLFKKFHIIKVLLIIRQEVLCQKDLCNSNLLLSLLYKSKRRNNYLQ